MSLLDHIVAVLFVTIMAGLLWLLIQTFTFSQDCLQRACPVGSIAMPVNGRCICGVTPQ